VIAEDTRLKRLDWEKASETRRSSLVEARTLTGSFFGSAFNRLASEYSSLGDEAVDDFLVIRHNVYFYESPGAKWLALNPAVGRQCGWDLVEKGLFAWSDNHGQVMVESLWWTDGLVDQAPPHFGNEVGEGWLVVARPDAVSAILAARGLVKRRLKISRKYQDKDGAHEQSAQAEEDL
jgi:hypothetical protein